MSIVDELFRLVENTTDTTDNLTKPTEATMNETERGNKVMDSNYLLENMEAAKRAFYLLIYISAPIIFVVGVIGNVLTIVVMRRPSFRKLNAGVYFSALACADTVCLCVHRLTRSWFERIFGILMDVTSRAGCKILMFTHYTSSCCGSWLIVAVTIERLIVVCFPLKAKVICTRGIAKVTVGLIVLFAFAANSYTLFLFDIKFEPSDGYNYCLQHEYAQFITTFIDLALYSFLPSIALWTTNIILIIKLRESDDFRHHSTATFKTSIANAKSPSIKPSKTTFMLLAVSFTFFVLTTPVSLYYFIQALTTISETWPVILRREVLQVLSSMNPAVNFILYCVSGSLFRKELHGLCSDCCSKCHCQHQDVEDQQCCMAISLKEEEESIHGCCCWRCCTHIRQSSKAAIAMSRHAAYKIDSSVVNGPVSTLPCNVEVHGSWVPIAV